MHSTSFTCIAILLTIVRGFSIADPVRNPTNATSDHPVTNQTKLPDFKIRVSIEQDGKLLDSYESNHVGNDTDDLECVGVVNPSDKDLWRLHVDTNMSGSELSSIYVRIEDLQRLTKSDDSSILPIEIYTSCVSARGMGTYKIGYVQGVTIKVEISKEAEQVAPSNR